LQLLPRGAFLFKSFNKIHYPAMQAARQLGHKIVVFEEEMLGQTTEFTATSMLHPELLNVCDVIAATGEFEASLIKKMGAGNIVTCGNARIDLLKPSMQGYFASEVEALKRLHGDYVLFNTNFPALHSIWGSVEAVTNLQIRAGFVRPDDSASVAAWRDYLHFEEANRRAIFETLDLFAKTFPHETIILRPHPGERLDYWSEITQRYSNIKVIREGSHVPWTLGAKCLIHTSCTTGLEAYVAGQHTISLVPEEGDVSRSLMANMVNPKARNAQDVLEFFRQVSTGATRTFKPDIEVAKQYIWNFPPDCCNLDVVTALLTEELPQGAFVLPLQLQSVKRDDRLKDKFNVSLQDMTDRVSRAAKIVGLDKVRTIMELGDSLFMVQA
jgi:surface carbohydrate biosynthesis protein